MSEKPLPSSKENPVKVEQSLGSEDNQESLSETAKAKAEKIMSAAKEARANDDRATIDKLNQQIEEDPELSQAINESQNSIELNLQKIKDAQADLSEKMQAFLRLANDALSDGVVTETVFDNDEERDKVVQRIKNLEAVISEGNSEDIEQAISQFSDWYQNAQKIIYRRVKSLVSYFNGSPPDRLMRQAMIFDDMEDDISKLNHYLSPLIE